VKNSCNQELSFLVDRGSGSGFKVIGDSLSQLTKIFLVPVRDCYMNLTYPKPRIILGVTGVAMSCLLIMARL
jgi:hypothetical protein